MKPGERIKIIKRIVNRLGAEDDWGDIDLTLEQFGFDTWDQWSGTKAGYVRASVKDATDARLYALDQYFEGHTSPDEEPWEDGRFKMFVSHVAKQKAVAHQLKYSLAYYGVDGFVAHEDIKPGKEWQLVIESALHSCDGLVSLLHEGFRASAWCDQEVGFALGRGVPVVPINFDLNPYGFFGSLQAVDSRGVTMKVLAKNIVNVFLTDKRSSDAMAEAIVERLCHATSFNQANDLCRMLNQDSPLISRAQAKRLRRAEKVNGELQGAFYFDGNLSMIEAKIDAESPPEPNPVPAGYDPAEEPF